MQDLQVNPGGRLQARCNECSLRLRGDFEELRLDGKDNFVTIEGRARVIRLSGQHNSVECLDGPEQVWLRGSGQRVTITEQPGRARPMVQVEGTDQGVTYRPANEKASSPAAAGKSAGDSRTDPPGNTRPDR